MCKMMTAPMLVLGTLGCCLTQASSSGDTRRIPEVEYIGTFSNMRFTEEHAYGSQLELWGCGGELFGLLSYSEGLIGDTPTGILEDVSYDPETQAFAFRAKLTTGIVYKGGRSEPSRDLFQFSGALRTDLIVGTLTRSDQTMSATQENSEDVTLTEEPMDYNPAQPLKIKTVGDWVVYAANILRRRGPQW